MRGMDQPTLDVPSAGRVVVRYRLVEPDRFGHTLTDVVGEVVCVDAGAVTVASRHGEVVVPRDRIVAAQAVPPRPGRRGAPHRALSIDALQEVMLGAWGALERAWLGRWQLRAGGGYTMRANSVAVLGDPGVPLAEAVDRATQWYAVRSLPLNVTLAGPCGFAVNDDPLGEMLLARGAAVTERVVTMTAATADVVAAAVGPPLPSELRLVVTDQLTGEWLEAHHSYRASDQAMARSLGGAGGRSAWDATARAVLTGSPRQLFASIVRADGLPVALGRAGLTPGWAGLASVWVDPARRREGLARCVTAALLSAALRDGARSTHLQVLAPNAPARALYTALGFLPHHDYVNLVQEAT